MSKASVIFNYKGTDIKIQCSKEEKVENICQKFATKIRKNANSFIFLYGGSNLNVQLSFKEQANRIDKERNEMKVLVYKNECDELGVPKCGKNINLNKEKINDIKSSIKNIDDTVKKTKLMIEPINKISTMEFANIQLKNVNHQINSLNEDINKLKEKLDEFKNKVTKNIHEHNNIEKIIIIKFNIII